MVHAIRIHQYGGPEVLKWEEVDVGAPGPGQIKVRHKAIGLNYIDTYFRTGLYKLAAFPAIIGTEGAGEVVAVGPDVTLHKVGDRIAYNSPPGAYAEERLMPADRAVALPAGISYEQAAAMMLQGGTVRYLLRQTYRVGPGTVMLLHAAAGGVGLLACQWGRHLGATIIGTAGSPDKCALARDAGATHVINYRTESFVERVREITGGKGCDVVYDSVGKDTFPGSLDCLKPRGLWVTFGNSSGPVPPFEVTLLSQKGALFCTRPVLVHYTATRGELVDNSNELFDVVSRGIVKVAVNQTYPLREIAQAHRDLEARKTTGSTVLIP
jgi:NADPH2:quinone reductase